MKYTVYTLIFFDEIQECPNALNSLKYFCEETPEHHVISAGSLLGVRLAKSSFPVGKVNFLDLYPMTFLEFLKANNHDNLVEYLSSLTSVTQIPDIFHTQLTELLKTYLIVGGMPEAVSAWISGSDIERVNSIQKDILSAYERDFSKHLSIPDTNKVSLIWKNIPSQLAKENKRFIFSAIKESARARDYEGALNWLLDAGIITSVSSVSKPAFLLKAYAEPGNFKIYLNDVGLLRQMTELDSTIIKDGDRLFTEFKGAFTENYVLSMLRTTLPSTLFYHTFDRYEVDFVTQLQNKIIPIEVKSGERSAATSLLHYISEYQPDISIKLSPKNLSYDHATTITIPLYLAERIQDFVSYNV